MGRGNVYILELEDFCITSCCVNKEINSHGSAKICGYLLNKFILGAKTILDNSNSLTLRAIDDGENDCIVFVGMIESYEVKHLNDYDELNLKLIATTKKMDLTEKTRVFQTEGASYDDIISYVNSGNGAIFINNSMNVGTIDHMSVQYMETDWNYIKRLASEKNSFLVPEYQNSKMKFYIGMPIEKSIDLKDIEYKKELNILGFKRKKENLVETVLENESSYIIELRNIFNIGKKISINNKDVNITNLYIYKIESKMQGAVLVSKYYMKKLEGLKTIPIKNYNIIGASITARVEEVLGDKVKAFMDIDGMQAEGKQFEFATVYSSNDDTGWYCMPEIGDVVRVYFPSENEDEAFVFNAMQVDKAGKNPSIKFFRNPQGKEIEFGTDYLKITNNEGLSIVLDDKSGISIISQKDIRLDSGKAISIESSEGAVNISATENIKLQQNEAFVEIDEDVTVLGKQIHMQEIN